MTLEVSNEEIEGEITFGAFANPMLGSVLKRFGKKVFARTSALMEFESFLKRIGASGETCIEIGTYQGITAVILSQYFERVICISLDQEPPGVIKKQKIVDYLGIKNVVFYDINGNDEKQKIISKVRNFDFCYLDGDHANDTRLDFDMVKRCGRVLFHEYWPIQESVWNLVNSLPQDEVIRAEVDCFAYWERRWIGSLP